jgi:Uma2 family endonuclease
MIANGLAPKRAELLEGVIVEKMSKSLLHTQLLTQLLYALKAALGETCWVRPESPITIHDSEPEPDISVVSGKFSDYLEHPTTALLVAEISVSTLAEDRAMAAIYASAGVKEYWLLNAPAREVEIFRRPEGGVYLEKEVVTAGQTLTCQSLPQVSLTQADLWAGLPPAGDRRVTSDEGRGRPET